MSKQTAAASTIEISEAQPILMLAMELGESGWLLGFSSGFGQTPVRRKIDSRDGKALLAQIAWAKRRLGLAADARVVSCYEAGRDGFWLHRFLAAHGVENLVVDSASIEVNRRKRRAKTDRVDLVALLDLLARHLAGSAKPVWSVVRVPSVEDEDRRHLHRELKLAKKDRTRVSHRLKGLLANQGLTLDLRQDLRTQLAGMQRWDAAPLPPSLRGRLERYVEDYDYLTGRIDGLEAERRRIMREETNPVLDKVRQLYTLKAVGINTAWAYGTEFFGWRDFRNGKQVGSNGRTHPHSLQQRQRRSRARNRQGREPLDPGRSDRVRMGVAALPTAERAVAVVPAEIRARQHEASQARHRGTGPQAPDRALALPRDGRDPGGRAAQDRAAASLTRKGKDHRSGAGFWCGRLAIAARCPRGPAR